MNFVPYFKTFLSLLILIGLVCAKPVSAAESSNYSIDSESVGPQAGGGSSSQNYSVEEQRLGDTVSVSESQSASFSAESTVAAPVSQPASPQTADSPGAVILIPDQKSSQGASYVSIISAIQIRDIADRSAVIQWITRNPMTSELEYGADKDRLENIIADASFVTTHRIYLKNLQPRSVYFFRVIGKTETEEQSRSDVQSFQTLPDSTAPSNVTSLRLSAGDKVIALRWENPKEEDFAGVMIRKSKEFYPLALADGELIFEGMSDFFTDTELVNGTLYYYTIFTFDRFRNFSSGSLVNGAPKALSIPDITIPPAREAPEIPIEQAIFPETKKEPETKVPPVAEPALNDFDAIIFTDSGPIKLSIQDINQAHIIRGSRLALTLAAEKLPRPVKALLFSIADSAYLFQFNSKTNVYEAAFTAPNIKEEMALTIFIVYEDGQRQKLETSMKVDPQGYVYRMAGDQQLRLKGARVFLYWFNQATNQFEIWTAPLYNQKNPVITDESGEYFFLVPPGQYYLEIGYDSQTQKTDVFEVRDVVVNKNIEWKQTPLRAAGLPVFADVPPRILLFVSGLLIILLGILLFLTRKKTR